MSVRVAVVQSAPVLFDRDATVEKVCKIVGEISAEKAQLILFPEAYIPCYPRGFTFGMVVGSRTLEGRKLWQRYYENAIEVPGPETEKMGEAAKSAEAFLAIGVIERDGGTLYCSLLYFGPDGTLLGNHRKLKPTGAERLIWGEGDGSGLLAFDTEIGTIGGLICWENYMPLARMAMYMQGVEIYLAPTADSRDTWHATMQHVASEGRCFVLASNQYVTKDMYPQDLPTVEELEDAPDVMCRGGSTIISPLGKVLAGPLYGKEGILYADLDMDEVAQSKVDFDVTGHYARSDVFEYRVVNQNKKH